jgi:hypothetical protein
MSLLHTLISSSLPADDHPLSTTINEPVPSGSGGHGLEEIALSNLQQERIFVFASNIMILIFDTWKHYHWGPNFCTCVAPYGWTRNSKGPSTLRLFLVRKRRWILFSVCGCADFYLAHVAAQSRTGKRTP